MCYFYVFVTGDFWNTGCEQEIWICAKVSVITLMNAPIRIQFVMEDLWSERRRGARLKSIRGI